MSGRKKGVPSKGAAPKAESADQKKRFSGAPINRLQLVRRMIRQCTWQITNEKSAAKPVLAELIRLIALERELAGETDAVREIKVTWVEPPQTELLKSA